MIKVLDKRFTTKLINFLTERKKIPFSFLRLMRSLQLFCQCCRLFAFLLFSLFSVSLKLNRNSNLCPLLMRPILYHFTQGLHCCRFRSSVISSAPTIMRPQVRILSTPSMLFSICVIEVVMRK